MGHFLLLHFHNARLWVLLAKQIVSAGGAQAAGLRRAIAFENGNRPIVGLEVFHMRYAVVHIIVKAVRMTHDVQNVLVEHGAIRVCLAADNRHVVFAFVTRIPSDRHHLVLFCKFHHGIVISEAALAVFRIIVAGQHPHAVIGTELTDNHRHALIDKVRFHLAELVLNLGTGTLVAHGTCPGIVAAVMHNIRTSREVIAPVVLRVNLRAPINNVIQQRVGIRVIEMQCTSTIRRFAITSFGSLLTGITSELRSMLVDGP